MDYGGNVEEATLSRCKRVKWRDEVHQDEGGFDNIGPRPQDGRGILNQEMSKWSEGMETTTAGDDVTGAKLNPYGGNGKPER